MKMRAYLLNEFFCCPTECVEHGGGVSVEQGHFVGYVVGKFRSRTVDTRADILLCVGGGGGGGGGGGEGEGME